MRRILNIYILILIIASFFLVGDLFLNNGQPATFDGPTHITNMAQFYLGIKSGDFPVRWADGFANYGMPIPIIAQQITSYLGAYINFLTNNILLSFNIVWLLGAVLSTIFFYLFLRSYFSQDASFLGAFFFNFTSYRIINTYIRGAIPEFFAAVFYPLLFIGMYSFVKRKNIHGLFLIIISTALLVLTHPFLFVVFLFFGIPYLIYLVWDEEKKYLLAGLFFCGLAFGVLLTSYYIIPLFTEIKYFNYGIGNGNHLVPNQYLSLINYFSPNWYYYYHNDVFVRGNFIKFGLLESIVIVCGFIYYIFRLNKKFQNKFLLFLLADSIILIFFTTSVSSIFYTKINLLGGIQFPWRMLTALMFVSPIILSFLFEKIRKYRSFILYLLIIIISLFSFPQLYGKNFTNHPQSDYFFTTKNLHGSILNTIWAGKTEDYPVKDNKIAIISGQGMITNEIVKNSYRSFVVQAKTPIRIADYTFYFPGWHAYVNSVDTPIQFQDPNYRGIITYNVSEGDNVVVEKFQNTKIRSIANVGTIIFVIIFVVLYVEEKKFGYLLKMIKKESS